MPTTVSEPYSQTYTPNLTAKTPTQRRRSRNTPKSPSSKLNQSTTSPVLKNSDNVKPASKKPTKRKNSTTTEIELQIEIEESTKRAKVSRVKFEWKNV